MEIQISQIFPFVKNPSPFENGQARKVNSRPIGRGLGQGDVLDPPARTSQYATREA